ncbi:uncharacterized protein IL334_004022 [Kwoniella shivajii]|uniref:Uncharacterized protein n=1 Tax=Kwoniella shivajii TaxID=564305 RepID=A0ABZ1D275_9TREE|nr:hypothetical protein IL334_004022 [Kwoniella shivajii]
MTTQQPLMRNTPSSSSHRLPTSSNIPSPSPSHHHHSNNNSQQQQQQPQSSSINPGWNTNPFSYPEIDPLSTIAPNQTNIHNETHHQHRKQSPSTSSLIDNGKSGSNNLRKDELHAK